MDEKSVTVKPVETSEVLNNPDMGWVFFYYSNNLENYGSRLEPADTLDDFPGLTTVYLRLPWAYLEPEEGKFNWAILDTPAQRWINKGKRIALRFTTSENWLRYATPEWVRNAGAKGVEYPMRTHANPDKLMNDLICWEPDFGDPVFLGKLENFLAAAGARYNGDTNINFIDVGTFGVYGEGHTSSSTHIPYPYNVLQRHIDLHHRYFHKTQLIIPDSFLVQDHSNPKLIQHCMKLGLGLRDDSVLVSKDVVYGSPTGVMMQMFWPIQPTVLEAGHYGTLRGWGTWGDGSGFVKAVKDCHASYASIHWWPREFLEEMRPIVEQINQHLGYRFVLREASWLPETDKKDQLEFRALWSNTHAAPIYQDAYPCVTLKDDHGGIVGVFVDENFNFRGVVPDVLGCTSPPRYQQVSSFIQTPQLKPGTYGLFISVGSRIGTPEIALPLSDNDGQRRYRLGNIRVLCAKILK